MPNLRRLPILDVGLIILLIAVIAGGLYLSLANAELLQEKSALETRLRASQIRLGQTEEEMVAFELRIREAMDLAQEELDLNQWEAHLEALRRRLEEARQAPDVNPFLDEAEAAGVTRQIGRYARKHDIAITRWHLVHTSTTFREKIYPAVRHSLYIEGQADASIDFLQALIHLPVPPVIESMDITRVPAEEDVWRMRIEMMVFYAAERGDRGNMD